MSWTIHFHHHATILGLILLYNPPTITAQQPPPWVESNQNYNSPMATALIVMIIVFFTVGFISVFLRHFLACLGIRPYGTPHRSGGVGGRVWMREPSRGLDPSIVNTFPTFLYSDVKVHKTRPLECAICLNEFTDHQILRLIPKCSHVFHPQCIGPWLASHVTCPVCRTNLEIQVHNQGQRTYGLTSHQDELEPEPETSNQIAHQDDHLRDVYVRVGLGSPETQEMIKGLCESGRLRLQRSHSTGHSLFEKSDRFTLRLPQEVCNKFVNVYDLSGLPAAIVSPRVGYRTRPSSPKLEGCVTNSKNNVSIGLLRSPIGLFKSLKSPNKTPLNHVAKGNDIGERSSDRLFADRGAQDVELENH